MWPTTIKVNQETWCNLGYNLPANIKDWSSEKVVSKTLLVIQLMCDKGHNCAGLL